MTFLQIICCLWAALVPTTRPNAAIEAGRAFFETRLCSAAHYPVSFTYGGVDYRGLDDRMLTGREIRKTKTGKQAVLTFALDGNLEVKAVASFHAAFGEVEYTLWFENVGNAPTAVLENLMSADLTFQGFDPVLRGCLGDHVNQYAAYQKDLSKDAVTFVGDEGRATHKVFPYFDLVHGEGGTLIAVGWAGNWTASFEATGDRTSFRAANCNGFRASLLPGEKIRTALVVLLPYKGRNGDDATNLWREWFLKANMPRYDAGGKEIQPFSTTCFAADTGLPNSDGSISERFYTWKRTLERLVYEDVVPDFRWIDAGWYADPSGHSVASNWWGTVGAWQIDSVKWPGNTFRASNDACHQAGMKTLLWFEPERVTHVEDLVRCHGYKAEWAIPDGKGRFTNNLGDPQCLEWTLQKILHVLDVGGIDLYREDNNSDPGRIWPLRDAQQETLLGLLRRGITENMAIQGHYALWDGILAFCAKNGKCTFLDSCASGGGRNDIESLRRSIPFLRSDADRTTSALRLSMTSTFNKWIPFCGASTKESVKELEDGKKGGSDSYVTRASWLPVYNMSESWTHDVLLDYDKVRSTYGEWKRFRHLLIKDFYVLTPWHSTTDTSGWTVFAYHDRETDESVIEAFRQETCGEPVFVAKLPFARKNVRYVLENVDTGEILSYDGQVLETAGFSIQLPTPRSAVLWHVTAQKRD